MVGLHGTGIFLGVAINLWGELWRRIIGYSVPTQRKIANDEHEKQRTEMVTAAI
jgi:hypothetical protein